MARNLVKASSQYLNYSGAPVSGYGLSMACWFKPTATSPAQASMTLANATSSPSNYIILYTPYTGGPVGMVQPGAIASTSTNVSSGTWQHACGTINSGGTSRAAYLNGTSKGTNGSSISFGTINQTLIGSDGYGFYLNGDIAEAAIWSAELTDAEVAVLAAGISPLLVRPSSLVAYWPLVGRYSPEIDVRGGNAVTVNAGASAANHPRIFLGASPPTIRVPGSVASGGIPRIMYHRRQQCMS